MHAQRPLHVVVVSIFQLELSLNHEAVLTGFFSVVVAEKISLTVSVFPFKTAAFSYL